MFSFLSKKNSSFNVPEMTSKNPKDKEKNNNLLLIRSMKDFGNDLWYKIEMDESDHALWKLLSRKTKSKSK